MSNQTSTRMGQHELHHPTELNLYHKNPRVGDVDAIAASLRANNQYKPVTVNKGTHTGRPNEVLAGNHTVKAIRDNAEKYPDDERWQEIDCWVIDVDDDRAARIVAADNRTAEMGSFDDEALLELLSELDGDLEGTGYTDTDLQALEDLNSGPPSLEDLEDEVGNPTPEDLHARVSLSLDQDVADRWKDHRANFDNDTDALDALLDDGFSPAPEDSGDSESDGDTEPEPEDA